MGFGTFGLPEQFCADRQHPAITTNRTSPTLFAAQVGSQHDPRAASAPPTSTTATRIFLRSSTLVDPGKRRIDELVAEFSWYRHPSDARAQVAHGPRCPQPSWVELDGWRLA